MIDFFKGQKVYCIWSTDITQEIFDKKVTEAGVDYISVVGRGALLFNGVNVFSTMADAKVELATRKLAEI